jgi:hypothetical protein
MATRAGSAAASVVATAARAPFHDVSVSPDSVRTSGVVRRSSELMVSKPKRPLSHSQPQLTGSLSTPR